MLQTDGMPSARHQGILLYPAFALMLLGLRGKEFSHQIVGCKLTNVALIIMLLQTEEKQMAGSEDEIRARSPVTKYSGEPSAFLWRLNLSQGIRVTSIKK